MPKQISPSLPAELRRVAEWLDKRPDIHADVREVEVDTRLGTTVLTVDGESIPATMPDRRNAGWCYWDGYGVTLRARIPTDDPRLSEMRDSWHRHNMRRPFGGRDA